MEHPGLPARCSCGNLIDAEVIGLRRFANACLPPVAIGLALVFSVIAQVEAADQKACSEQGRATHNQTLSERLGQTNGVICPPDVDPDIKAPTPKAGKMPVIPPPGSPGGDPNVQPK